MYASANKFVCTSTYDNEISSTATIAAVSILAYVNELFVTTCLYVNMVP